MNIKLSTTKLYLDFNRTYDILGSGKEFSMDDAIFITDFRISSEAVAYQFVTWRRCCPEIADYGFITNCNPVEARLVFNSQESRASFTSWWESLDSHFPSPFEKQSHGYPRLPVDRVATGTLVPCSDNDAAWAWIVTKCKGYVWFLDNRLLFESDSDVVMYKIDFLHTKDG